MENFQFREIGVYQSTSWNTVIGEATLTRSNACVMMMMMVMVERRSQRTNVDSVAVIESPQRFWFREWPRQAAVLGQIRIDAWC